MSETSVASACSEYFGLYDTIPEKKEKSYKTLWYKIYTLNAFISQTLFEEKLVGPTEVHTKTDVIVKLAGDLFFEDL